jgi:hypothetical protein
MTAEANFIHWLLPDAEAAGANWTSNPQLETLDPAVQELFADVECRTGVPRDWLAKAAGLVVDGLAGLQCLWWLHGASGDVEATPASPGRFTPELNDGMQYEAERRLEKARRRDPGFSYIHLHYDWAAGVVEERRYPREKDQHWVKLGGEPPRVRKEKLGKLLKRLPRLSKEAKNELFKAFETREMTTWHWKISADPLDVLTMSFRRPWTSCMRPPDPERDKEAGEAQYGPLTDMAAGAAVVFFYRPGATQPAGRTLIRPGLDAYGNPIVLWCGDRTYGSGPSNTGPDELEQMLAPYLEPHGIEVQALELCPLGEAGNMLTRGIYSDVDNTFCRQSDDEYLDAYEGLGTAPWPKPALEGSAMRSVALQWAGKLASEASIASQVDVPELVDSVTDSLLNLYTYADIFGMLQVGIGEEVDEQLMEWGEDLDELGEDIVSDITYGVRRNLEQNLNEVVEAAPTDVFALQSDVPPALKDRLAAEVRKAQDVYGGRLIWPNDFIKEEGGATLLVPLQVDQDGLGTWRTQDGAGEPVNMLLVVSQALEPVYGQELLDMASAQVELPPGAWPWDFEER